LYVAYLILRGEDTGEEWSLEIAVIELDLYFKVIFGRLYNVGDFELDIAVSNMAGGFQVRRLYHSSDMPGRLYYSSNIPGDFLLLVI